MSDGFAEMLDRAQAFYGQLAQNNTKHSSRRAIFQ